MIAKEQLDAALAHQKAGRLDQAASLYERILAEAPDHADALHLSALIALRRGDSEDAISRLERAARAAPTRALIQNDLGAALRFAGRIGEAAAALRRATELAPDYADAWNNLGIVQRAQSDYESARATLERAAALKPGFPPTFNALGGVLQALGQSDAARAAFERALALKPDYAEALTNLGLLLHAGGEGVQAVALLQKVVGLAPTVAEPRLNLGLAQFAAGQHEAAVTSLQQAVRLNPRLASAWNALGIAQAARGEAAAALEALAHATALAPQSIEFLSNHGLSLHKAGRSDEALAALERALAIDPCHADAIFNRGVVRHSQGDFSGALADWKATLDADPGHRLARSNLIFALHYEGDMDSPALLAEARAFERHHGRAAGQDRSWPNVREPQRRLRIGYVSPDFREHSIAHYMEPLLAAHDRDAVEIFAYAELKRSDDATLRLKKLVDVWRPTAGLHDGDVARLVRADAIDILVDLAGHSADNRLGVFALKPAPVQASWLGFPGTTGLSAIDYRMTDAIADPIGADGDASEALVRLPRGFHCWRPPPGTPAITSRDRLGAPVFGSFNNVQKVSPETVAVWADILSRVPEATLALKSSWLSRPIAADNLRRAFTRHGIAPERLAMSAWVQDAAAHFAAYDGIDVALDPHPYNGTTTTLEALWMGVPVVTMTGDRHAARVGSSLLRQVGADALIATSPDDYIAKAVALIQDRARLSTYRGELRDRLAASSLMDAAGFARVLEETYRGWWRRWCGTGA